MKKRAQVTIFIIIAILIVASIVMFFLFREKIGFWENKINPEVLPVYSYVEDCVEETEENALARIGEQGGYFFISQDVKSIGSNIPYYLYNQEELVPTKADIELELSGFVHEELSFCILNFKDFRDEFEISHELKEVKTKINDNSVDFNLQYLISVSKKESEATSQFEEFNIRIPIRLGTIYNVAQAVVQEQQKHLDSICLSCLYTLGKENNVHIDMLDYGNDTTIFTIIDNNSTLNDENYEFSFAVKHG